MSDAVARAAEIESRVEADRDDDAALADLRSELDESARRITALAAGLQSRLQTVAARLDQIGPAPGAGGSAEPELLTQERSALQMERAEINALLGQTDTALANIAMAVERISQTRRELFAARISERYDLRSALNPTVLEEWRGESLRLTNDMGDWVSELARAHMAAAVFAIALSLAAAFLLFLGGRRLFGEMLVKDPDLADPPYISRLSVALWSTVLPTLSLALFLGASYFFFDYLALLPHRIGTIAATLLTVIVTVFFVGRLARAVFSPRLPNWRLVEVESRVADKLYWLILATAVVTGLDFVLIRVTEVLSSPLSLTVARSFFATMLVGVLVISIALVKPLPGEGGTLRPWPRWLRYPLLFLGAITIIAALLGYIGFARFLSQQIVITGAIISTMYLGFLAARAVSDLGALYNTAFGRRLEKRFKLDERMEDQVGLAVGLVLNAVVLMIGIPLILLQWGFQWGDMTAWAGGVLREVRIGSISISLTGILAGILVFILGYFATRWLQSWIDGSVMARGKVDAGVRNSIRTVIGYLGLAIALMIGISAAGVDLSNLALIAGGLSLGIGFGLQNIVQNFVSGLILLVERPFKAGDWIVAGNVSGTVKKISVRATEIETFQRQSVILPNSELINAAVGNWTHKNRLGRVEVPIGVGYDSDPRRVHTVLNEVVRANPNVLKNPEPIIVFTGFGASSLDFEVRFFLADITAQTPTTNEIKFAIFERLKGEGVEIPFPQRDLHIRSGLEQLHAAPASSEEDVPPTGKAKQHGRMNKGKSAGSADK